MLWSTHWPRIAAACLLAFAVVTAAVYFLIDNTRLAGTALIAVVVGLAGYLLLGATNPRFRAERPLALLLGSSAAAIGVGVAGIALALVLVALTRA